MFWSIFVQSLVLIVVFVFAGLLIAKMIGSGRKETDDG